MGLLDKLFGKKEAVQAETAVPQEKAQAEETPRHLAERELLTMPEPGAPVLEPLPPIDPAAGSSQPLVGTALPTPIAAPRAVPISDRQTEPEAQPELEPEEVTLAEPEPDTPQSRGTVLQMQPRGESAAQASEPQQPQMTIEQMRSDPNFVRVFDQYGQEVFLTKQQWREEILPASLQANWDAPDELYAIVVNALNEGMVAEVEPATARLHVIDPLPVRGMSLYSAVLLQLGKVDESERVLEEYRQRYGEDGAVLTNLAKVYATRNQPELAKETLWRAIELDPNQENGVGWYLAGEFEAGGEDARRRGLDRVAALPGSWRAQLWQAKIALDASDLPGALRLYNDGLKAFPGPVPTEFLYPMSGDLGIAGHLHELIDTTEPRFLPEIHGLTVGNNLIKAHADLGELEQATAIVNRLFAMKRPDWRETLGFWEGALARARAANAPRDAQLPLEIGMLEMIGPVWKRAGGPLTEVFGDKPEAAPVVTILGGTAELTPPEGPQGMQMADAIGRLSRPSLSSGGAAGVSYRGAGAHAAAAGDSGRQRIRSARRRVD